jgi:hypothetical protein
MGHDRRIGCGPNETFANVSLELEFCTDRGGDVLEADDYAAQFAEIERVRDFFAAAAKAGHAVIAAAI